MLRTKYLWVFIVFFFPSLGMGDENSLCDASAPGELINCLTDHHPDVLRAEAGLASATGALISAKQRPNPEFETEALFPDGSAEPSVRAQSDLLFALELGGKRRKRIAQAESERVIRTAKIKRVKDAVKIQNVLDLIRLRQVRDEIRVVEEGLHTFETILRQYRRPPRLSPEQSVSVNVFLLAQGDYELKKSSLIQERDALISKFTVISGIPAERIANMLPEKKNDWPAVSMGSLSEAWQREAAARINGADRTVDLEKSRSIPDVWLGPQVEIAIGRGHSNQTPGAVVAVALPIFQRNQGAVATAEAEREEAILERRLLHRELTAELVTLRRAYTISVEALEKAPSLRQMESKHQDMESFFERGLVSASLIIEAHRQISEFTRDQNEHEIRALRALWTIYGLEGRVQQESL